LCFDTHDFIVCEDHEIRLHNTAEKPLFGDVFLAEKFLCKAKSECHSAVMCKLYERFLHWHRAREPEQGSILCGSHDFIMPARPVGRASPGNWWRPARRW